MRPVTESLENLDLSGGTSKDFNKLVRSISYDITNVFNAANENEASTERNLNIIIQENLFLQRKIKDLESKLLSIEETLANKKNSTGYNSLYKTFRVSNGIESLDGQILHDPTYGIVTMPCSDSHRAPLLMYPKEFLARNIDIKVDILGKTIGMAEDPSLINLIDGNDSSFWISEAETSTDTDYIDFTVTINMPLKILPSLHINSVGIKPHPVYSLTLSDIKYVDPGNGIEHRLPTFPSEEEFPVPIRTMDNVKFMFPAITAGSVSFSFRQPYYSQDGDTRKFVFGLRGIDLENLNVTKEEVSFITEFKIPGDAKTFSRILEPVTMTLNGESYGDAVTHELYYDKAGVAPFVFGSNIASEINTVYLKTTLKRAGETIPAVRGLKLRYLPK